VNAGGGIFYPIVVIDGHVHATWKRTVTKGSVTVRVAPFDKLNAIQRTAINRAAERYGKFLGTSVRVV
jgi:hypothetical protein